MNHKQEFQDTEIKDSELNLETEASRNLNSRQANENTGNQLSIFGYLIHLIQFLIRINRIAFNVVRIMYASII